MDLSCELELLGKEFKKTDSDISDVLSEAITGVVNAIEDGKIKPDAQYTILKSALLSYNIRLVEQFINGLSNSARTDFYSGERTELEAHLQKASRYGIMSPALNALWAHPRIRASLIRPEKLGATKFRFTPAGYIGYLKETEQVGDSLPELTIKKSAFRELSLDDTDIVEAIESLFCPLSHIFPAMMEMQYAQGCFPEHWLEALSISQSAYDSGCHHLTCSEQFIEKLYEIGQGERSCALESMIETDKCHFSMQSILNMGTVFFDISNHRFWRSVLAVFTDKETVVVDGKEVEPADLLSNVARNLIDNADNVYHISDKLAAINAQDCLPDSVLSRLVEMPSLLRDRDKNTNYLDDEPSWMREDYWLLICELLLTPKGLRLFETAPDLAVSALAKWGEGQRNVIFRRGLNEATLLSALDESLAIFSDVTHKGHPKEMTSATDFGQFICMLACDAFHNELPVAPYLKVLKRFREQVIAPDFFYNLDVKGMLEKFGSLNRLLRLSKNQIDQLWGSLDNDENPHFICAMIKRNPSLFTKTVLIKIIDKSNFTKAIALEGDIVVEITHPAVYWRLTFQKTLPLLDLTKLSVSGKQDPLYKQGLLLKGLLDQPQGGSGYVSKLHSRLYSDKYSEFSQQDTVNDVCQLLEIMDIQSPEQCEI